MFFFAATILLSAFLLFQVQPQIAKAILPWFGGSAAVWATCLVFFQTILLLGYLYAHRLTRWQVRTQFRVHATLLAIAVLTLPIIPSTAWKPGGEENPTGRILFVLALTVGLPYFLLSSTGPLLQAWFVRWRPGTSPYRLFALSNLGSILGLITYPSLAEPWLALKTQAWVWSGGFVLFALVCAYTAWRFPLEANAPAQEEGGEPPSIWNFAFWIALAAGPSMLLLAITTHLAQDVASIPFLWVLPLVLYLLSFILCFDARGWYRRPVFLALLLPAMAGVAYLIAMDVSNRPNIRWLIALYALAFFIACMVGHGELSLRKPHPRYLTGFYLCLSIGGALGGAFVALAAPAVFNANYELYISLGFIALLGLASIVLDRESFAGKARLGWWAIACYVLVAGLLGYLTRLAREHGQGAVLVARNYYGEMKVRQHGEAGEWDSYRTLVHGTINHGEQYIHPQRRRTVATYYCANSGLGLAIGSLPIGYAAKVGIIGLGTGTVAGFARPGDTYRFYEINPLVQRIANQYFTYLQDSDSVPQVVLGDARLSLEREPPQNFDVLAMDAFSSDSIPAHLVTVEALQLYLKHLLPDGIMAIHISNRYVNMQPVLERAAGLIGKTAYIVETDDDEDGVCFGTSWVLITSNERLLKKPETKAAMKLIPEAPWLRAWTDDYSNLLQVLK